MIGELVASRPALRERLRLTRPLTHGRSTATADIASGLSARPGRRAGRPGRDQRRSRSGVAIRRRDRPGERVHTDQRDPRRAAGDRARHRLGHRRDVRPAHHRQQRRRDHPGGPRQAHARPARHRQPGQADGPARRVGDGAARPTRSSSTTSSNSARAIRSSSTAPSSRPRVSRSTSRCSPARPIPSTSRSAAEVLSGSFVASGTGAYRATKVGREAYAAKLADGGEQVHAGAVGAALGDRPDPQVHHLPDDPRRAC